jgi:hypothetical protein
MSERDRRSHITAVTPGQERVVPTNRAPTSNIGTMTIAVTVRLTFGPHAMHQLVHQTKAYLNLFRILNYSNRATYITSYANVLSFCKNVLSNFNLEKGFEALFTHLCSDTTCDRIAKSNALLRVLVFH